MSSPAIEDVHDPMLDTESIESVRSSFRVEPAADDAASIFLTKSISINVFGRIDDDAYKDMFSSMIGELCEFELVT